MEVQKTNYDSVSTAEAEYRALGSTMRELLWVSYIMQDLLQFVYCPIPLHCDNLTSIHITTNQVFHERTKHLDMDCHVVRDQYKLGFIHPTSVATNLQTVDVFTKALVVPCFHFLLSKIGLGDLHQVHLAAGC